MPSQWITKRPVISSTHVPPDPNHRSNATSGFYDAPPHSQKLTRSAQCYLRWHKIITVRDMGSRPIRSQHGEQHWVQRSISSLYSYTTGSNHRDTLRLSRVHTATGLTHSSRALRRPLGLLAQVSAHLTLGIFALSRAIGLEISARGPYDFPQYPVRKN